MLEEVWRDLCAVAILTVSVVTQNYAAANVSVKDYRDGHVYRAMPSGMLNWFSQDLKFRKKAYFSDENDHWFYREDKWEGACPEGTRIPDESDWESLVEDEFSDSDKIQNVKSFVGESSWGYFNFDEDNITKKKNVFYYAVRGGVGTQAMMLDTKRGSAKLVKLEEADALQIRCVSDRDFLAEKGVSKKDMLYTDNRDGKKYKVQIRGGRIWMMNNLAFSLSSPKQCYVEDPAFCEKFGRYYTYEDALKACPNGWHLPDDHEWREFQKDRASLDWENLGRGGCQDWDNYCDGFNSGHYWSSTSIEKDTGRSWEFRKSEKDIERTDASVHKGLYVRCVSYLR